MRAVRTSASFATALLAMCVLVAGIGAPASAAEDDLSAASQTAFRQLGECLSKQDAQLNVLYVLDASSSLALDTDRDRLRGQILAQAIDQLGVVSEDRSVYVAVSSFDLDYQVRLPWQELTPENAGSAADWAENQYSWWGAGQATNWLAALQGGDQTMRESPNAKTACKMLVWLTDGGINVNGNKSDTQANSNAMAQICGTDPVNGSTVDVPAVVNSLRSSNVHLIGVLLRSEEYLRSLEKQGRTAELADELSRLTYMTPITESTGSVSNAAFTDAKRQKFIYTCGTSPIPPDQAAGALLLGSSPIALAYRFSDLANEIRGGARIPVTPEGQFQVEAGFNFASIQLAGGAWTVRNPSGVTVATSGAPPPNPGVAVSQKGRLANIQLQGPVVVPGMWTVDVSDQLAPTQVYVNVLADGQIDIPTLQAGEASTLTVSINDRFTTAPLTSTDFNTTPLVLSAQQGAQEAVSLKCTQDPGRLMYTCPFTPASVGTVHLEAQMEVSTKSGNTTVTYVGAFDEDVLPEATFPRVAPDVIGLSDLEGRRGQAEGTLSLLGPQEGRGEVCLPEASDIAIVSDVVDRSKDYTFGGAPWGTCVPLAQGQTETFLLTIMNPTTATGSVEAVFSVGLKSGDSDRVQPQDVRLQFDTTRPGSPPPWLLIGLFAAGVLVPIVLLYGQARMASRLSLKGLQMTAIPVRLTFEEDVVRVERMQPPGGDLVQRDDWHYMSASVSRPRTFKGPESVELRALTPRNPLGNIRAEATAPKGSRILTSVGSPTDGRRGRMRLSPARQWYMVAREAELASDATAVDAVLVAFTDPARAAQAEASAEFARSVSDLSVLIGWATIRNASRNPATDDGSKRESPGSRRSKPQETEASPTAGGASSEPDPDGGLPATNPFEDLRSSPSPNAGSRGPANPPSSGQPTSGTGPPPPPAGELKNPFDDM